MAAAVIFAWEKEEKRNLACFARGMTRSGQMVEVQSALSVSKSEANYAEQSWILRYTGYLQNVR